MPRVVGVGDEDASGINFTFLEGVVVVGYGEGPLLDTGLLEAASRSSSKDNGIIMVDLCVRWVLWLQCVWEYFI